MNTADAYMDGHFAGLLMGYLLGHGLTPTQAEAEIALGCCSEYELVQQIAWDPADAARWSAQARLHRERGYR